jgi:hypothetical protein
MIQLAARELTNTVTAVIFHTSDLDQDLSMLIYNSDTSKELAVKLRDLANTIDSLREE